MSELEANKNSLRTTPEEEETIARARSGSSEAFAALAERYVPLIKNTSAVLTCPLPRGTTLCRRA